MMNDLHDVLMVFKEQEALDRQAARAHETKVTSQINTARRQALPVYKDLADAIAWGPRQPHYQDIVVLLGAVRTLIVKHSEAVNDLHFDSAVDAIDESLLEFSNALAAEERWHEGEDDYSISDEMADDDLRNGVDA